MTTPDQSLTDMTERFAALADASPVRRALIRALQPCAVCGFALDEDFILRRTWLYGASEDIMVSEALHRVCAEMEGMDMNDYHLIAVKRAWIPERLYALLVRSFWKPLCSRQPLRWVLHEEIPE